VTTVLTEHRDRLETLAQALLEHETLDELDAYTAAQMPPRTADAGTSAVRGGKSPPPPHPDSESKLQKAIARQKSAPTRERVTVTSLALTLLPWPEVRNSGPLQAWLRHPNLRT
jgi:hypothetical protein